MGKLVGAVMVMVEVSEQARVRALERKGFWLGFGLGVLAGMLVFVVVAVVFYYLIARWLDSLKG